jgi:O-methyltransferase
MLSFLPLRDSLSKVMAIASAKPYTMVDYPRLEKAYSLIDEAERYDDIPGTIVECGSWNGGYAAIMNAASERNGHRREVWVLDSFEGLPEPDSVDKNRFGKKGKKGVALGDIRLTQKALSHIGGERVHIVKGWFKDTFAESLPQLSPIAFLHLDVDYYESTKYCLEQLYPLLSPRALVLIDDYLWFDGCKKAVDEFLAKENISNTLIKTVQDSAYFRKP